MEKGMAKANESASDPRGLREEQERNKKETRKEQG
jgi:hypothetical protein